MAKRFQFVGIVLAMIGLGFMVGGGIAFTQVDKGYDSLQAFSETQNVTLAYNEDGQLVDRGTTEGAVAATPARSRPREGGAGDWPR